MIIVLVEGNGDARSLPVLFSKSKGTNFEIECVDMKGKSNIIRKDDGFEKTILRKNDLGNSEFALLLDGDVMEPYKSLVEEKDDMTARAANLSQEKNISVRVFWAIREYESWLVGGLRSGDRFCGLTKAIKGPPGDTEAAPIDPKEWIKSHRTDNRYDPDIQVCLTQRIDIGLAKQRNSSLRKIIDEL
ncbi:MAG: hypothetical protein HYR76_04585 [Ignavibacteria bacterium]|nr:hypothetical protein [Ignavibacteria bacterium]MBI3765595.1 hypothetical protein [Ignavibacteriales bacterium]